MADHFPTCRLLIGLILAASTPVLAAPVNTVQGVQVSGAPGAKEVRILTSAEPTFTVFRLQNPMRVVVDISGGDISKLSGPVEIEDGTVGQIAFQQFSTDGFKIARLIVGFDQEVAYDVQADGQDVIIRTGNAPSVAIGRAPPPPMAPVDRAAAERFETARNEAESAAQKATQERSRAEQAATYAKQQQQEAERLAKEADSIRKQADVAKTEAENLRKKATEAISRDRSAAEVKAKEAEAKLNRLHEEETRLAVARTEAERSAAESERARRAAEEQAARAEADHKRRVAELEEKIARAEKEQQAAKDAWRRAKEAKQQADEAQHHAEQAKLAYAQAEQETEKKLTDIARREKELSAEKQVLAKTQQQTEAQRQALQDKARTLEKNQQALQSQARSLEQNEQMLQDKARTLEKNQQALAEKEQEIERRSQHLANTQKELQQERKRLAVMQKKLEQSQAKLEQEQQSTTGTAQELATKKQKDQKQLAAERVQLATLKASLEKQQNDIQSEQQRLEELKKEIASIPAPPPPPPPSPAAPRLVLKGVERRGVGNDAAVLLVINGKPLYEVQRIEDPPRLVLDLADTDRGNSRVTYGVQSPCVRRVRVGDHGSVTRVVMDLSANNARHSIEETAEGLLVRVDPPPNPEPKPDMQSKPVAEAPTELASSTAKIKDIRFSGQDDFAQVVVELEGNAQARVDDRSKRAWVLELRNAELPKTLERSLDTTAFGSLVRLVSTYQDSTQPPVVKVVANLEGSGSFDLQRKDHSLIWTIKGQKRATVATAATPQTAGYASEGTAQNESTPAQPQRRGRRVNIDIKDADIVNVIRLLQEESGENIIIGEEVTGKVTLKLNEVPWEQALDTILKTKGYDKVRENNILRIASAETIRKEKEQAAKRREVDLGAEETYVKMYTVNYADAEEIVKQVVTMKSTRGSVQVDARTNTLILEDVQSYLLRLVELVKRLDKQTPQVLIEARIVEASSNNLEQLGIQWGGIGQASSAYGNATGLRFPGQVIAAGGADDQQTIATGTSKPGRYAVNLPAPIGAGVGGGIGFTFGSANGAQLLNLRLSALESTGHGRIVSSPRITTLDNKAAKISQGVDIPITVTSAAGANTKFIPAVLELEVTPHVTNDGSVMMTIKVSKNEPDFTRTGGQGDPTILRKYAETQVLVRDGDTSVIGGIYTRTTSQVYSKVPFLGDIPVIGWLFKNRREEDSRAELLVFITPRIMNRQESLVESATMEGKRPEAEKRP